MKNSLFGIFALVQIIIGITLVSPSLFTYVSANVQFDSQPVKTWNSNIPSTSVNVTIWQNTPAVVSSGVIILPPPPPPNTESH